MTSQSHSRELATIARGVSLACAAFAIIAGGVVLIGWTVGSEILTALIPGLVQMNPATAVAFMLAGGSLWLQQCNSTSGRWGRGLAACVALIGFFKVGQYMGLELPFDRLMFSQSLGENQMAPNTAMHFTLLGLALVVLDWKARIWLAQPFALAVAAGSLLALVGYGFGVRHLYGMTSFIPMALNTALVFEGLAIGVLCSRPGWGVTSLLLAEGTGGVMFRRLLPVAVIVPIVLGWLRLLGELTGVYGTEFGVAIFVAMTIVCFITALWWTGRLLDRTDAERRMVQEQLRAAHCDLEIRVRERTADLADVNASLQAEMQERNRVEEHVRQLNLDLRQRLVEQAETNRALAEQSRENEMFIYSVSHDLRSPLVNLQGFSKELGLVGRELRSVLSNAGVPPSVRDRGLELIDGDMDESIRFIQTAVTRLGGIIEALLRLSRAGRIEYRIQRTDIQDAVQRIVEAMSGTISDRGATVIVRELPPASGDPTALEQIFANLIGNALNYLDPNRPGEIEIGCLQQSEGTTSHTYYVRDNGLGIDEKYQAKVFQAFQRLHPQAAKGEGMGLALVRRIVERHHGSIRVESAEGCGSTFLVELPAAAGDGMEVKATQLTAACGESK